jgi:hypothetical protein
MREVVDRPALATTMKKAITITTSPPIRSRCDFEHSSALMSFDHGLVEEIQATEVPIMASTICGRPGPGNDGARCSGPLPASGWAITPATM